jgi:hypothetical protein
LCTEQQAHSHTHRYIQNDEKHAKSFIGKFSTIHKRGNFSSLVRALDADADVLM